MKPAAEIGSMEDGSGEPLALRGDAELLKSVVSLLEEDVVPGRKHPRERLIEDELMRRSAAKGHMVGRALADLQQMGIVEQAPNQGAMARAYREEEIQALYVLRNLLEGHAALIPMLLPKPDIEQLKAAQAVHDRAIASGHLGSVFHANVDFREPLFAETGNACLAEAIRQSAQRTRRIRFCCLTYPGYLEQARCEHCEIIAAVEKRDRQSLVRLCHQHLLASRQRYEKAA
jgi:DNA-binding GntR family transcriptional regulator